MICAALRAESTAQALEGMREARRAGAGLVELRLDYLRDPDLPRLLAARPLPVVATARPRWEGGAHEGPEADRLRLLEEACRCGAEYVDLESRAAGGIGRGRAKLILSFHDFEGTPADLAATASEMKARGPDVVKIACRARGASDLARLVRLQKSLGPGSAVVAMGEAGEALRILYARYGGSLTYGSLRAGSETAPGQVTVEDLVRRHRVPSIDAETELYGLVPGPGVPGWGVDLFNDAFRCLGRNARCVRIPGDDAAALEDLAGAMGLRGLSAAGGDGFLHRAEEPFRAWTGRPIPEEVVEAYSRKP